jgi:hypothetical protein
MSGCDVTLNDKLSKLVGGGGGGRFLGKVGSLDEDTVIALRVRPVVPKMCSALESADTFL